jgi:hypothetical protein
LTVAITAFRRRADPAPDGGRRLPGNEIQASRNKIKAWGKKIKAERNKIQIRHRLNPFARI